MGFGSEGDRCFAKRCNGLLVYVDEGPATALEVQQQTLPLGAVDFAPEEHRNGHEMPPEPEEKPQSSPGVPVAVLEPPQAPEGDEEVPEGPLGDRKLAVATAREVIEGWKQGVAPTLETIASIRRQFHDLGSIYRPERGYPDMAKAREQHRGQFFTSPEVGELIWRLIKPPPGVRVLESSIGCGNLIARPDECFVTGMDVDRDAVTVSRAILGPRHCIVADEMQHHQFREEFELVLGNPPYSVSVRDRAKLWGRSVGWDGWGRGEVVWLEQAALAVKRPGVVAAVLPVGMYEVLSPRFVEWLESRMSLVAEVVLPRREAHVFSEWPVSLYVWLAGIETEDRRFVYECETLEGWLDGLVGSRLEQELTVLLDQARRLWAKNGHQGPLAVRPWQKPREREVERDLPLVEEDVVLLRVSNGKLMLVPNGIGAQAKLALLRLEMGNRYDRKQEVHVWHWDELITGPPLLNIGKAVKRMRLYGIKAEVDGATKRWLARRRRWYRRQMAKIPRWISKTEER
jgi:hypothetical protein